MSPIDFYAMNDSLLPQIQLFKSVFKGREDVFAIRWEKDNKNGYMPAYYYDQYLYRAHKMNGGTFQTFQAKSYLKLSEIEIAKHLLGEQQIGIYPLLEDNTSYFLAADFDKSEWLSDAIKFLYACHERNIPAYLERSSSGKGGHVWIFFEQPYPAVRSRKIFLSILEISGAFSMFDKGSSFDRLFPNQDFHSGKGLGNLIALPLFKKKFDQGNNCFIDPNTQKPFSDQYEFLRTIKTISIAKLDQLYQSNSTNSNQIFPIVVKRKLIIELNNEVKMNRDGMTTPLITYLKEELNFANSAFIIKKKIGKNTFGTERFFRFVEETENKVIIPRGFIGKLIRFCRENKIEHNFVDLRKQQKEIPYILNAKLKEHQQSVIDSINKKDLGVIVAPPGSGKTIVALKIIADKKQPALIIVHRKQLVEQWIERVETFLGIPKHEIGKIGQGKSKIGKKITIATIQSLAKEIEKSENEILKANIGIIIVDECHHIPALTYRNTISKLQAFYFYGLTATPFRKYNDDKLIYIHLGEIIAEIKSNEIDNSHYAKIVIRNTELDIPFNSRTDHFETLSKILIHDSSRNKLILNDVINELKHVNNVVIITERKEHIDSLNQYLKQSYETITLSGDDSETSRKSKWKILKEGNYRVLITTGQLFGEGTDLQNANSLFLVYPFSFEGKLIQYIGRVQRSEVTPTIYDYRDIKIDYLNKMFLKRNTYYRKINKQISLFDEPNVKIDDSNAINVIKIERDIKVPIKEIEFGYGGVTFKHFIHELKIDLEIEIENIDLRPEFVVLKQYFIKTLKSKYIYVHLYAEFEDKKLVSQIATSRDIEKINRNFIDSVKFNFFSTAILVKQPVAGENLLDINQIQDEKDNPIYSSGEELLEDILQNGNYKHLKQLEFLASQHDWSVFKIRFILSPFSFVFLLSGDSRFHIVLETLDTEEATYIWHFDKVKSLLNSKLKEIDEDLGVIRNKGRQFFLANQPENFSRILHDYSAEGKGFIIWKDLLEEQIN